MNLFDELQLPDRPLPGCLGEIREHYSRWCDGCPKVNLCVLQSLEAWGLKLKREAIERLIADQ